MSYTKALVGALKDVYVIYSTVMGVHQQFAAEKGEVVRSIPAWSLSD
jgi:hypothetical protein